MALYGILNYWGIRLLTRANNAITIIKFIVPVLTAIIMFMTSFHPANFLAYHNTIAPYGFGKAFKAIVTCGIFYSFFGFSAITSFTKELKNPQRNIPLALAGSIIICLIIYLFLQVSFIGAVDPVQVKAMGWDSFNFTSPLAQLAILLGVNWLALVMYVDAAISPSGTAVIYVGSSARMFTGMAEDGQMPKIFAKEHAEHGVSRLAILVTLVLCMSLVVFFDNWDKIMVVVSVFLLISCLAVPIAFVKLRIDQPSLKRPFRMPLGNFFSYITYLFISFMLVQCGTIALGLSLTFHAILFLVYGTIYYRQFNKVIKALASSWSIFVYLAIVLYFGHVQDKNQLENISMLSIFFVCMTLNYYFLLHQKSYNQS
jgi:amino acid transporter